MHFKTSRFGNYRENLSREQWRVSDSEGWCALRFRKLGSCRVFNRARRHRTTNDRAFGNIRLRVPVCRTIHQEDFPVADAARKKGEEEHVDWGVPSLRRQ